MDNIEINVFLRPKTGLDNGKMQCNMSEKRFVLIKKSLFKDTEICNVLYKDIERFEDSNYMFVPGVQIYFNKNLDFPSSPTLVVGGLIGGLISLAKKKKYILYFNNNKEKQIFINNCIRGNDLIKYNKEEV